MCHGNGVSSLNFTLFSLRAYDYLFILLSFFFFLKLRAEKYLTLGASLMTRKGAAVCRASLIRLCALCERSGGSFILESLTPLRRPSEPSPRRATCCMPYIDEPGGERSVRGIFALEPQAVFDALSPRFSPHLSLTLAHAPTRAYAQPCSVSP